MIDSNPEDSLIEIWADPRIRGLARRWARDAETAEDALQATYIAVKHRLKTAEIENLRGYFVTVLRREIYHQTGPSRTFPVDDFSRVADERHSSSSFEEGACSSLDARARFERFIAHRDRLILKVAARSDEPARYRAVISSAVAEILLAGTRGDPSEADLPPALRAAYPEYFAQPGITANACDQRCHRARMDVKTLLKAVVTRAEIAGE